MPPIPAITGIGLVTPLGRSAQSTFDALLAGRFITTHAKLEPQINTDIPRVISLAIEAADEAMARAGWNSGREAIAVVACTSKGSVESWISPKAAPGEEKVESRQESLLSTHYSLPGHSPGLSDLSAYLADHIGSTAERLCISAACASGLHGLIRAAMLIQSGQCIRVLIVAAEASVHPLFLASFSRLGLFPPAGGLCRPFDKNRSGFLMSEAAAAICLEAADDKNRARTFATVDRYAIAGDATHLTGSDPNAAVVRHLLERVLGDQRVDLIHAHGTGTLANDATELAAFGTSPELISRRDTGLRTVPDASDLQKGVVFRSASSARAGGPRHEHENRPATSRSILYSHKAALGHTLGASGLVATAINCLCHRTGMIPGNINTTDRLPAATLTIARHPISQPVQSSLIHAAGFGGPMAVVRLSSQS